MRLQHEEYLPWDLESSTSSGGLETLIQTTKNRTHCIGDLTRKRRNSDWACQAAAHQLKTVHVEARDGTTWRACAHVHRKLYGANADTEDDSRSTSRAKLCAKLACDGSFRVERGRFAGPYTYLPHVSKRTAIVWMASDEKSSRQDLRHWNATAGGATCRSATKKRQEENTCGMPRSCCIVRTTPLHVQPRDTRSRTPRHVVGVCLRACVRQRHIYPRNIAADATARFAASKVFSSELCSRLQDS